MDSDSDTNTSLEGSSEILNQQFKTEDVYLNEFKSLIEGNQSFRRFDEFLDDKFLLHFVRGKKYDVPKAFETLENYFHMRTVKHKAFFKSLSSNDFKTNNGLLSVLKQRDHLNRLIVIGRARQWNPRELSVQDSFKLFILMMEEIWNTEDAEENGVVVIFDMANWNLAQIKALSPGDVIRGYNLFGNNIPLKYKGFHFVNEIYIFSVLLKVAKPIFPKKVRDRMHFHSSYLESLHQHIYPDVLPKSLGGLIPDEKAFDEMFEERIQAKELHYRRFAELL